MEQIMKKTFLTVALAAGLGLASGSVMADRVEHFKGTPSETLEQAVKNFSEYNAKLEAVLAGELTFEKVAEVHELTYTLEVALEKINDELEELAETLEELHVASEENDFALVKAKGEEYLSVSRKVIK
ncbi:hypothetical protein CKO35_06000 [Ectothiorhodospira shaposhnikovii]|nr:hypothetical protein [Ectothiorhodospira shaposhnikovii]